MIRSTICRVSSKQAQRRLALAQSDGCVIDGNTDTPDNTERDEKRECVGRNTSSSTYIHVNIPVAPIDSRGCLYQRQRRTSCGGGWYSRKITAYQQQGELGFARQQISETDSLFTISFQEPKQQRWLAWLRAEAQQYVTLRVARTRTRLFCAATALLCLLTQQIWATKIEVRRAGCCSEVYRSNSLEEEARYTAGSIHQHITSQARGPVGKIQTTTCTFLRDQAAGSPTIPNLVTAAWTMWRFSLDSHNDTGQTAPPWHATGRVPSRFNSCSVVKRK